jgi:hypothetical protein
MSKELGLLYLFALGLISPQGHDLAGLLLGDVYTLCTLGLLLTYLWMLSTYVQLVKDVPQTPRHK